MTEEQVIDAFLSKYYHQESFALDPALKEYTGENNQKLEAVKKRLFSEVLIEKMGEANNEIIVSISLHAKNLVDAGGYSYFYGNGTDKKAGEKMPRWSYEVSGFQYYLFWPVFIIAILEAAFIIWKLLD